jgi:Matrixin/PEP-CTERM motif
MAGPSWVPRSKRLRAFPHVLTAVVAAVLFAGQPARARADPVGWPQPDGPGTPVFLTYSFSNLLEPEFGGLSADNLRAATEEAFGLWSRYAPLHFLERPDSGPPPSDAEYLPDHHPAIRIGALDEGDGPTLARTFLPVSTDSSGLAGDILFNDDSAWVWGLGTGSGPIDFLEVITHEIGHAVGIEHITTAEAIMNPHYGGRFDGLGTGFLFPADIHAIRALYGAGVGSVEPIPEPSTVLMIGTGLLAVAHRRLRGGVNRGGGGATVVEAVNLAA